MREAREPGIHNPSLANLAAAPNDEFQNASRPAAMTQKHYASTCLNTTEALVPPKPNEFDSTQPSFTLSCRARTIGMSANAGSRFSMLALSQTKPEFIIRSE